MIPQGRVTLEEKISSLAKSNPVKALTYETADKTKWLKMKIRPSETSWQLARRVIVTFFIASIILWLLFLLILK